VPVCGVNLWDEIWENGYYDNNGNPVSLSSAIRSVNYCCIVPNSQLYCNTSAIIALLWYDENKTFLGNSTVYPDRPATLKPTVPNNAKFFRLSSYGYASSGVATYNNDISINYPSSDTQYHAYNGNTYTFAFGQTVYGGHFDNKGNLVITHIMLNFSDLNFNASNPSSHVFRGDYSGAYLSNIKFPSGPNVATEDFTERYVAMAWQPISASDNGKFALNDYGTLARFVFIDYNFSTQADFETARANDKIIVALKTPITLSITSQDIPTLLENNIFSNCGDVEVEYYISNSDDIVDLIKSAGSGGHTIVDDAGTDLAQRTNLQFKGAYSEDNSTDDTTEVNVVREMTKAEFDQLTEEEKIGLINITDITGGNDDRFQPVIYSEEEREIGVWTDGKPLYQKTVIITNITITLDDGYSYDISSWNVDTIVKNPEGFVTISNETDLRTVPFGVLGEYATDITSTRSAVKFSRKGGSLPCNRVVFTLTYTKTTDTAGSGQWTPQGVPAHHYSENEQVVGTWIDGSTIYEKTFDLSSVSLTNATWSNNVLGTSGSNIKIRKFSGTFNITGGGYTNEPYADYIYYRSEDEYFTAVINGAGDDINLRPQINGVTMTAGVCTIRYTKSST
jgi:hypothetical protein